MPAGISAVSGAAKPFYIFEINHFRRLDWYNRNAGRMNLEPGYGHFASASAGRSRRLDPSFQKTFKMQ